MKELQEYFPPGVDYSIVYDTTPFINESISQVGETLFDAIVLVALVVLVFLQSWRSTLIPIDRRAGGRRLRHIRGHGPDGL